MEERHEREQYFFDGPTLDHLAEFVSTWSAPCCLCAPLLGQRLSERGVNVTILDVDERFAEVAGFRRYDLYRPAWLQESFDLILCDPPSFGASLSQLFRALRTLSHNDFRKPLLVSYLKRRESAVLGTFAPFNLKPTGYFPGYQTVRKLGRNEIEFFGNLADEDHERLRPP